MKQSTQLSKDWKKIVNNEAFIVNKQQAMQSELA